MAVQFKFLKPWLPTLIGGTATLILSHLGLVSTVEPFTQRLLFQARGAQPWQEDIVLIKIDETSINALGWFPWRRDRYTELLHQLTAAEVETVAFNILFSEATTEDADFAQAMADHGQVLLGTTWYDEKSFLMPTPILADQATAMGHMTQVEKTIPVTIEPYIQDQPALAIATAQVHQLSQGQLNLLTIDQPLLANWPGPIDDLPQYSFIDVLEQRVPKSALAGKIALVGMTAAGFDPLLSPMESSRAASGIHLHAAVLHSYLQQNFLYRPPMAPLGILALLVWGISLRFGLPKLTEGRQLTVLATSILLWPILGILALQVSVLLPITLPMLLLSMTCISLLLVDNTQLHSLNGHLHNQATTDALTGLKNRAFFNDYSAYLWRSCRQEHQSLCLILCDVDHFKQYNDTYGHPQGDRCLYAVAQSLQGSLYRDSEIVARYGGEEFVILLPNATVEQGCTVAQRIQAHLANQAIPHKNSATSAHITLSFGIADGMPQTDERLETLIEQADQALYRAKQAGRDRYHTHNEPSPDRQHEPSML